MKAILVFQNTDEEVVEMPEPLPHIWRKVISEAKCPTQLAADGTRLPLLMEPQQMVEFRFEEVHGSAFRRPVAYYREIPRLRRWQLLHPLMQLDLTLRKLGEA